MYSNIEKKYWLYLTNCGGREEKALSICRDYSLTVIGEAIVNIMNAMFDNSGMWWWSEKYARQQVSTMLAPFIDEHEPFSEVKKLKQSFYHLGFIITNYPMWPDGNGSYLKDFYI